MKRIFIAVKISPGKEFLKEYSSLKSHLGGEKINWVAEENIHITLVFLGDTEEGKVNVIKQVLEQRCSGFGNFPMRISGTGLFRSEDDPRVIWAGIENPEKISRLASSVTNSLADSGFKPETKPFKAHVTLGRIKFIRNREKLRSVLNNHRNSFYQDIRVTEVILYESILNPSGPVYKPLAGFPLK